MKWNTSEKFYLQGIETLSINRIKKHQKYIFFQLLYQNPSIISVIENIHFVCTENFEISQALMWKKCFVILINWLLRVSLIFDDLYARWNQFVKIFLCNSVTWCIARAAQKAESTQSNRKVLRFLLAFDLIICLSWNDSKVSCRPWKICKRVIKIVKY